MKKLIIALTIVLTLGLFTGCTSQANERIYIGIIQPVDHPSLNEIRSGFIEELATLGYIDGETVTINYQNAQGDAANYKSISEKLVKESDIIFAIATPAAQAVAAETSEIPVILGAVSDPVAAGLVTDLSAQGTNITGVSDLSPLEQQFDFLLHMQPTTKTVGIVYNSSEVNSYMQVQEMKKYAEAAQVTIIEKTITNTNDVQQAIEALANKVDALYIPNDNTLASSMPTIKPIVEQHKLPLVPSALADAEIAGIGTIGITQRNMGVVAARQADAILSGDKQVEDMPIEIVTDVTLYINEDMSQIVGISEEAIQSTKDFFA